MRSPRKVTFFSPSTNTGAAGDSPVPGRLMPMFACLDSPGPLTMHPMTATFMLSTPGVFAFPGWHLFAQVGLDFICEILKNSRCSAAASGAGDHHRGKLAQSHRLQQFLCDDHFPGAVAARL